MRTIVKVAKEIDVKLEEICSAYSGEPYKCMCGCSGTHYYASSHRNFASEERGYSVRDDEINDAQVKRIFNLVNSSGGIENIDDYIFSIYTDTRQYTIYRKPRPKASDI